MDRQLLLVSPDVNEVLQCLREALKRMEDDWDFITQERGGGSPSLDEECADGSQPEIAAVRAMIARLSATPMVAYRFDHHPPTVAEEPPVIATGVWEAPTAAPDASETQNAPDHHPT